MILKVFSVFDSKLQVFNTPFFSRSEADATRSFSDLVRDSRTTVGQHPGDFFLIKYGMYDIVYGIFHFMFRKDTDNMFVSPFLPDVL